MTHRKTPTPTKTGLKDIERIQPNSPKPLKKPVEHLTPDPIVSSSITKFRQNESAQVVAMVVACFLFVLMLCAVLLFESTYHHDHDNISADIGQPHDVAQYPETQHGIPTRDLPDVDDSTTFSDKSPLCSDPSFPLPRAGDSEPNRRRFSNILLAAVSQKFDHMKITKSILETDADQYYEYLYREYSSPESDAGLRYDPLEILNDVKSFHALCTQGVSRYSPSDYSHIGVKSIHELKRFLFPSLDREALLAYSCSRGHITPFCINFVGRERSLSGDDSLVLSSGTNFGSTDLVNTHSSAAYTDNKRAISVQRRVHKMIQLGLFPGEQLSDTGSISASIIRIERHLFDISKHSLVRNVDPNSLLFHSDVTSDVVNHETMLLFMNLHKQASELEFSKSEMRDWLESGLGFSLDKYIRHYCGYYQCDTIELITASDGIEYFEHLFEMLRTIPASHLQYYLVHCIFYSLYDSMPLIRKPVNLSTMEYSLTVPWKTSYRMEPPDDLVAMSEQFCNFISWGYMSEHLSYLSCLISDVDKCYLNELYSSIMRVYDSVPSALVNGSIKMNSCASLLESYPEHSPNGAFAQIIAKLQFENLRKTDASHWDLFSGLLNHLLMSFASSPVSPEYNYSGPTYDLLSGALVIPFGWSASESVSSRDQSHHFETSLYSSGLFECLKQLHKGTLKNYSSYMANPDLLSMFSVLESKRRLKNELDLSESFCNLDSSLASIYNEVYEELSSVAFSLNHTLSLLKSTGIYKLNPRSTLADFFALNAKHRTSSAAMSFLENISTYSDYLGMSAQLTDRLISLNRSGYLWHLRRYKLNQGIPGQPLAYLWNHHDNPSIPVDIQVSLEETLRDDDLALLDVFRKDRLISQCIFSPNPDFLKSLYCDAEI